MKKIICFLLGLMLCPNLFAQVYSNDAELVSEENGNVTLRSSGTADKKKEATALAIKSAFNTLFHSGGRTERWYSHDSRTPQGLRLPFLL